VSIEPARRVASASPTPPTLGADFALLLATLVWGASFPIVGGALTEISPLVFVALRFSAAALLFVPFAVARGGWFSRREVLSGAVVGIFLFLGFATQTIGLATTAPARAAFLTGLCVVIVPLLQVACFRRVPPLSSLLGVALATAGLALLTGIGGGGFSLGDALVLACAVAFAVQILAVDRFASAVGPLRLLAVELGVVAALAWPAALATETVRMPRSAAGWGAVASMALLATLGALLAQNWAQQRTPPTRAAVILAVEPVVAALCSYAFTGERLGGAGLAGSALILAGMVAAEVPGRRPPGDEAGGA
jgi:drug/metabolite transporter (DMT)-like permease